MASPPLYAHAWLRLDEWSPDGRYLIVDDTGGHHVLDSSGNPLWRFDAWDSAWLDSTTIVAAGSGDPNVHSDAVRIYDLSGEEMAVIPTEFETEVFAPDHHLFAGTYPATGDLSQGDRFSIWNGQNVSDPQIGNPRAWSADATQLAVLLPPFTPGGVGMEGRLAIGDQAGRRRFVVPGWFGSTIGDYEFSLDNRYLAACLSKHRDEIPLGTVVDTQTGEVTELGGACSFSWTDEPALYAPGSGGQWLKWTPDAGAVEIDNLPADAALLAARNGNLAISSSDDPALLRVVVNGKPEQRRLPGVALGYPGIYMLWSADGQSLAVVYAVTGDFGGGNFGLTIVNV